jgi:LPS sulfotransferase NodH
MELVTAHFSPSLKKRALDLGLYGQTAYAPFVVIGRSRVGSNLLRGLLNAHPEVVAFGEVFRDVSSLDWDHTGYFQSASMGSLVRRDPVAFLDTKVFGRYPRSVRAVGFKLFYYHARQPDLASVWDYLEARTSVKIVHLKRQNLLQTHLSRHRAALSDRWVDTAGNLDPAPAVRLDYEECLKDFRQTRAWEEECDRAFARHPLLQMHYERLAADRTGEIERLQVFLGLSPHAVEPTTFQQAKQPLSAAIVNYGELEERFRATPWAEFFVD